MPMFCAALEDIQDDVESLQRAESSAMASGERSADSVGALGAHDVGGLFEAFEPIKFGATVEENACVHWEKRTHALLVYLAQRNYISTDELRRGVEALPAATYNSWSYYGRWNASILSACIERKLVDRERVREILFGDTSSSAIEIAEMEVGQRVRVKHEHDGPAWRKPHLRTPGYLFGALGTVEQLIGTYPDPSLLAFNEPACERRLYRVTFFQRDLWPEYSSESTDTVSADVYEHWLVPLGEGGDEVGAHSFEHFVKPPHNVRRDHGDHVHDDRFDTEQTALERDKSRSEEEAVAECLFRTLCEAKVVDAAELRALMEQLDERGQKADGKRLVARCWVDEAFKRRFLENPADTALEELGIRTSNPNAPTALVVRENTEREHNLVVCTLCSCYPTSLLGMSPAWYKSRTYRARAVREPRAMLREFGLDVPTTKSIRVLDSTADVRYMVIPQKPPNTEGWTEEQLLPLITRDSMLGVALAKTP